jgi:hypothetical protein
MNFQSTHAKQKQKFPPKFDKILGCYISSVCRSDKWFIAMCYIGFVTYTGKILSQFWALCSELEGGTIRWKKVP